MHGLNNAMDKKQFRDFLESVAEIKELKPVSTPNIRLDENCEDIVRMGDQWVEINAKVNPTLGIKFLKLKPIYRVCELGCGDIVENQIIEKKLHAYPEPHWRTSCKNCNHTLAPDGNGFIKGSVNAQNVFFKWLSKAKAK